MSRRRGPAALAVMMLLVLACMSRAALFQPSPERCAYARQRWGSGDSAADADYQRCYEMGAYREQIQPAPPRAYAAAPSAPAAPTAAPTPPPETCAALAAREVGTLTSAEMESLVLCEAERPPPTYYGTPASGGGGDVQVRGYYRRDGTYVRPHTRSRPGR